MFNDVLITGQFEMQLDGKNRMFIPAKTGVEGKELVVLKRGVFCKQPCLYLIAYRNVLKRVDELEKQMSNCSNFKEFAHYNKLIESYCLELDNILDVDRQHRIVIPQKLADIISATSHSTLYGTGAGKSLVLTNRPTK